MQLTLDLDDLEVREIVLSLEQQRLKASIDEQDRFAVLLDKLQVAAGLARADQGAPPG